MEPRGAANGGQRGGRVREGGRHWPLDDGVPVGSCTHDKRWRGERVHMCVVSPRKSTGVCFDAAPRQRVSRSVCALVDGSLFDVVWRLLCSPDRHDGNTRGNTYRNRNGNELQVPSWTCERIDFPSVGALRSTSSLRTQPRASRALNRIEAGGANYDQVMSTGQWSISANCELESGEFLEHSRTQCTA